MPAGHPEGILVLKPAELAALTFVLTRKQGASTQHLPQVATGPARQVAHQTSGTPSRPPGAYEAEGRLGSLCTAETPTPGSSSAKYSWHSFSYIPKSSVPFSPLVSPTAPSGGTDRKPKTLVRLAFAKSHQRKPSSSKYFIRSMIFGEKPDFKSYVVICYLHGLGQVP